IRGNVGRRVGPLCLSVHMNSSPIVNCSCYLVNLHLWTSVAGERMPTSIRPILLLALLAAMGTPAAAQSNLTPAEERNKTLVMEFWQNVFLARNPDRAADYLADNFVEHNPIVTPGNRTG